LEIVTLLVTVYITTVHQQMSWDHVVGRSFTSSH